MSARDDYPLAGHYDHRLRSDDIEAMYEEIDDLRAQISGSQAVVVALCPTCNGTGVPGALNGQRVWFGAVGTCPDCTLGSSGVVMSLPVYNDIVSAAGTVVGVSVSVPDGWLEEPAASGTAEAAELRALLAEAQPWVEVIWGLHPEHRDPTAPLIRKIAAVLGGPDQRPEAYRVESPGPASTEGDDS